MTQIVDKLRSALEFASFKSPDIRDAFTTCIKELAKDMHEVEFEPDVRTIAAFRELDNCITEYENASTPAVVDVSMVSDEVDEVDEAPDKFIVRDEIEHVIKRGVVEADDDDVD